MKRLYWNAMAGIAFVFGCGPLDVDIEIDATARVARARNTAALNGRGLNGRGLNGRGLNGRGLDGRGLNGRGINGRLLSGAYLTAPMGSLNIMQGDEVLDLAADFGGSLEVDAALEDGTSIKLRISAQRAIDPSLAAYTVEFYDPAAGGWYPIEVDANGAAVESIPLRGKWNREMGVKGGGKFTDEEYTVTFAVRGYALAKCAEWGYLPWTVGRKYHQACTRMVRADYCGDGNSWTYDGTLINIFDDLGVQLRDTEPPAPGYEWRREGEWQKDGANCVTARRVEELDQQPNDGGCIESLSADDVGQDTCGAEFGDHTYLMTDFAYPL
jgi:hypothetical protein